MSETANKWGSCVHTLEALDALCCNSQKCVLDVTARLECAPVGVNVDVPHGSLDADAAVRGSSGVGVQDVHELGVVGGEGVLVVRVFKGGTCGIQAYRRKRERNLCCTSSEDPSQTSLIWPRFATCGPAEPPCLRRHDFSFLLVACRGSGHKCHYSKKVREISKLGEFLLGKRGIGSFHNRIKPCSVITSGSHFTGARTRCCGWHANVSGLVGSFDDFRVTRQTMSCCVAQQWG